MFRFAIKIAAVVFTIVLLFLSGYYLYLTKFSQPETEIDQISTDPVQNKLLLDHGVEVPEEIDQMFGKYDMYDGNRFYLKLTDTEKNWVFVKNQFELYCAKTTITEDSEFGGNFESKSSILIEELMEQGDDVLVGFVMENGEKYLDKILTDSPTACSQTETEMEPNTVEPEVTETQIETSQD